MEQQEYFMRINRLGQEAQKIEEKMQLFEQQLAELNAVKESLNVLHEGKEKEIYAHLGKGIFIKADIKEKNLLVNIGGSVASKKSIPETIKVIEEQSVKLIEAKEEMMKRIERLQEEMQKIFNEAQKSETVSDSCESCDSCSNEECECEEKCDDCGCDKKHKH